MPIEKFGNGGLVITGDNSMRYARLVSMRCAFELWIKTEMQPTRNVSIQKIVKAELMKADPKLAKGNKHKLLERLVALIAAEYPNARSAQ